MAIKLTLGIGTAIFLFIFVLGYIVILFSFLDDTSKSDIILEQKLNHLSSELKSHKILAASKDVEINLLRDQLKEKEIALQKSILAKPAKVTRPGVIVLGMHRSGTSILGGLLTKMGLKVGGPLIQPGSDNEKGFFERIDVVLQNDAFMWKQNSHYGGNTWQYDALKGVASYFNEMSNPKFFAEGKRGLAFLNDKNNYPWMLKDPRLCITFRTWLPLLNFIPAIIFTYRHPLDVSLSLHTRYEQYKMQRGLKLWYVYNKRAIQQSSDLCRVITSHHNVMKNPDTELKRIRAGLIACGVDVPHDVTSASISEFIDIKLQHGRSTLKDNQCDSDLLTIKPPDTWPTQDPEHIKLYREAMRVYCALEDGSAFSSDFYWDESIHDKEPW